MKVAVVGCGGSGGYITCELSKNPSVEVFGVCKSEQLSLINLDGFKILTKIGQYSCNSSLFTTTPLQYAPFDLVIFCVKSSDLEKSVWLMLPCIDSHTTVFTIASGFENYKIIKKILPEASVLQACAYSNSSAISKNRVKNLSDTFVISIEDSELSPKIQKAFLGTHVKIKISKDIAQEIWKKYLFIASFALMGAYQDRTIGEILLSNQISSLLQEVVLIAKTLHVGLNEEHANQALVQAKTKLNPNSTTAIQRDVKSGKFGEFEALCGFLYHKAKSLNLETQTLYEAYDGVKKAFWTKKS